MKKGRAGSDQRLKDGGSYMPNRREFLAGLAALGLVGWTEQAIAAAWMDGGNGFPARPQRHPLTFTH